MEVLSFCRLSVVLLISQSLFQVCVSGLRPLQLPSERKSYDGEEIFENARPLIGILSQPRELDDADSSHSSYIAASYVKFVEAGGARAVPLLYNEPEDVLKKKFDAINGILFPGGDTSLEDGPFYRVAEKLFNWAVEANDRGDCFPIYGVCLGYELLVLIVSQDHCILEPFRAKKVPGPLMFVDEAAKDKSIFKWFSNELVEDVTRKSLALENHKWGMSPTKFAATKRLAEFFEVLTTTPDQDDKIYVSTVQGRKYPITGVQYHPEKNLFEWGYDTIPHDALASQFSQSIANFVISEARKSRHSPASKTQELDFLIYNTNPVYTGRNGNGGFDQSYRFV